VGCSDAACSASDFDLRHHLYDTLILLGASPQIAEILKKSKDMVVTDADIDALRDYNGKLIDALKD
jgi:hypothetical protein